MQGKLVRLERPADQDYELMAQWFGPDSAAAVMAATEGDVVTAEDFRKLDHTGGLRQFAVRDGEDRTVGAVHYKAQGPVGGYVLGGAIGDPELWRRGFGAEAFDLLIDHLFHARNAHRVTFTTALYNKNVMRLVTGVGFTLEGILREYFYLDGRHHDGAVWGLLRHEYYAAVEELKRTDPTFVLPDTIPEADKAEARRLLAEYITSPNGKTSAGLLLASVAAADAAGVSVAAADAAGQPAEPSAQP
ncbi:GNAT family protein [Streptomyces rimosus]|uniref:GNAT family N-acetyltransferase n=1 Tax=Streptomyces rimosus TaxID=1927 RepID=UPI00067D225C|nr:GNAT family protein [Streptomyces rimosus]